MSATIIATGKIVDGEIHWQIAPLPAEEVARDGELQAVIDYGQELQELLDAREDMEDNIWHSRGGW
jgi:hypothetical protein